MPSKCSVNINSLHSLVIPQPEAVQHSDKTCLPTALPLTILRPLPSAYAQEGRRVCPKARAWGLVLEQPGPWAFLIASMGLPPWSGPRVGRRETLKAKWHSHLGELTAELEPWVIPPQEHPQGRLSDKLCFQVHRAEVQTICLPRTTGCLPSKGDVGGGCKAVASPCLAHSCHLTLVIPPCQSLSLFVSLTPLPWKIPGLCPCWPLYPWGPSPCLTLQWKPSSLSCSAVFSSRQPYGTYSFGYQLQSPRHVALGFTFRLWNQG